MGTWLCIQAVHAYTIAFSQLSVSEYRILPVPFREVLIRRLLQCVAVCCHVLLCERVSKFISFSQEGIDSEIVAAWCSVLQCVAVCCRVSEYRIL